MADYDAQAGESPGPAQGRRSDSANPMRSITTKVCAVWQASSPAQAV